MKRLVFVFLTVFFFSTNALAVPVGGNDAEVRKYSDEIIKNVIDGLAIGSYGLFSKNFSEHLKKTVDQERFTREVESLKLEAGKYINHQYMGYINQSGYTVAFYKAKYTGISDDVFFYVYLSKPDNSAIATGIRWFAKGFNR